MASFVFGSLNPDLTDRNEGWPLFAVYTPTHFFVDVALGLATTYVNLELKTGECPGPPPYTPNPDGYINPSTNEVGNGAGDFWAVKKSPYVGAIPNVLAWYWDYEFQIDYSTWVFDWQYSGQQLTNTASIYLKPTLASGYWTPASNWQLTAEGRFEELVGMPPNVFTKLDETFVTKSNNVWSVVFGSDEFGPLNAADAQPTFPDAPTEPTLPDQSDFVGTARGLRLEPNDYFFLKTWQFNYCTE